MGRRIGIIAGSGRFVPVALSELRRSGFGCLVLGIEGETRPGVKSAAELFASVRPGDIEKTISFFRRSGVSEIMFLGKIRPDVIFQPGLLDASARKLLRGMKERSATALLQAVFGFLEARGFHILSPASVLASRFYRPGVLTRKVPSQEELADIDIGLRIARRFADLEVGQTLVIKGGSVVAVEGIEGTDRAIRRGGRLAGRGFATVKAGRTSQDMKIDLPAVGLDTVKTVLRAGGSVLGIESGKVAFFQKEEAVRLADTHGLAIVVRAIG